MTNRHQKAHITQLAVTTSHVTSASWYCDEHRCWNRPSYRLCLCERPKEK